MSTNLSVTKSTLAKLLAGENINVVHKRISTAMFDLKTRSLYVPIWENMDGELYDLLMGHEVGHALNTPAVGWHSAVHDADGKFVGAFKDVLNVCEDARIEKMIKRKYPGLAKSFACGYKNLFERDFFGIKRLKDFSKLNLIDRINIYTKCGSFLIVPFDDEERELVREVMDTESWEQVVAVATKIYEKVKENQNNQLNNLQDLTEELLKQFEENLDFDLDLSDDGSNKSDDDSDDFESMACNGDGDNEGDEESDFDDESTEGDGKSPLDDAETDVNTTNGHTAGAGEDSSGEPQSITDRKFRQRERELIADSVEVFTYNLPKPQLDRIIVPNKLWVDNFYEQIAEAQKRSGRYDPIANTCARRFSENNNRYINLLVKEFEMRKNAQQYARTQISRTGELDMARLHQYKYSNDLFKKISVVQKGKNHGMIMYVDMSGSMASCFGPTMEQTLILVAFCRKVGIPFDVYGFSDKKDYLHYMIHGNKLPRSFIGQKFTRMADDEYTITEDSFHLIHFISSRSSSSQYRRAFEAMCTVAMNWQNVMYPRTYLSWDAMGLELGGTPFTQTVMASRPIIEKFKADNKVDITNVIYLTDGEGTGCFHFSEVKPSALNADGKPKIQTHVYLIDQKTKRRIELPISSYAAYMNDPVIHQKNITEFVRSVTGCKHIGFYIADATAVRNYIRSTKTGMSEAESKLVEKFWRENGYYSTPHIGYDMYYYVKTSNKNVVDDDYSITEDMNNRKIARVFTNAQEGKRKNRVLVSKFAQEIAA